MGALPTRGLKARTLRAIVDAPGETVEHYAAVLAPERPRFAGPVQGAADWRRRQDARATWAAECETMRPAVSRAIRRLASEGWVRPADVARLTPAGVASLRRADGDPLVAVSRARRLAILCGELPAEARQGDLQTAADILAALQFRETGRATTAQRLGIDSADHRFRSAWDAGALLGLWWLPQHRLPTAAAVDALGASCARSPVNASASRLPPLLPALGAA